MSTVFACEGKAQHRRVVARAGIFYGGQLQNRSEWPLVLDATRQTQGFRIEFASPLSKPARVHWEVVRPQVRHRKREAAPEARSSADATIPAGSERFDQVIPFEDTDKPGEWKLTVALDGVTALDTTIRVVPKPIITPDD